MNERLLSLARMARRLGVTQRWLRSQAVCGRVPSLRADRRFLFDPVAVEDALAAQARDGQSQAVQQKGVPDDK
jgi:hypothetical protein